MLTASDSEGSPGCGVVGPGVATAWLQTATCFMRPSCESVVGTASVGRTDPLARVRIVVDWGRMQPDATQVDQISQAVDLLRLNEAAQSVIRSSASVHSAELGRLLQLDVDIKTWETTLSARPEVRQLAEARRELGFAIYAAASGLYGLAYAGLRLFLELGFASVHFSANELFRRKWVADRVSFSWSAALDEETGLLSEGFVREFNQDAVADAREFAVKAAKCYRECSQVLHGKLAARESLPSTLTYSKKVLSTWNALAVDSAESVLFLLFCRYGGELQSDDQAVLYDTLEHHFSHLRSVRKSLQLPIEE